MRGEVQLKSGLRIAIRDAARRALRDEGVLRVSSKDVIDGDTVASRMGDEAFVGMWPSVKRLNAVGEELMDVFRGRGHGVAELSHLSPIEALSDRRTNPFLAILASADLGTIGVDSWRGMLAETSELKRCHWLTSSIGGSSLFDLDVPAWVQLLPDAGGERSRRRSMRDLAQAAEDVWRHENRRPRGGSPRAGHRLRRADPLLGWRERRPRFELLSGSVWQSLKRMHETTGHRPLRVLARALRVAGADSVVIAAAKKPRCDVCDEVKKSKIRRPAALPRARRFGGIVHADLIQVNDSAGSAYWVFNIVDAASRFQVTSLIASKSSAVVKSTFDRVWNSWAGSPTCLVTDMGPEFVSSEFNGLGRAARVATPPHPG